MRLIPVRREVSHQSQACQASYCVSITRKETDGPTPWLSELKVRN